MSVQFIPPFTPLLYSKNGAYRGILFFLIFALKHRLWVFVRTASISDFFHLKIIFVTTLKNCSILHGRFFVMYGDVFVR